MNERVDREPVAFGSAGVTLAGYLYRPAGQPTGPLPCVVMAHGFSGTMDRLFGYAERFAGAGLGDGRSAGRKLRHALRRSSPVLVCLGTGTFPGGDGSFAGRRTPLLLSAREAGAIRRWGQASLGDHREADR